MKIGIVGGTGSMGKGLALRWAVRHQVCLGSRSLEKAARVAADYDRIARGHHGRRMAGAISGAPNPEAVARSEVVVLTLPPRHTLDTVRQVAPGLRPDHLIVSTTVPMARQGRLFTYAPVVVQPPGGEQPSAAEAIAQAVAPVPVVSAFQTIPAAYLADLDAVLNIDILICGDDEPGLERTAQLVREIPNLRPLRVGPLAASRFVESLTPLLMNAAVLNKLREPSIRIVPWVPSDLEAEE
jgi:NADPH-dependent F420 reductase